MMARLNSKLMKQLLITLLVFIGLMSHKEGDRTNENVKNNGSRKVSKLISTATDKEKAVHNYENIENSSEKGCMIREVPEVSDRKLFEAIVGKYKGKVVIVDFWATWCGPCISDIKKLEPLKETELKNDNLVFVYLTNESSPEEKWRSMIPDIKGEHYRLSNKQFKHIADKFGIRGIPAYVLVSKNGKSELRNDLHGPEPIKKVLAEEFPK